MFPGTIGAMDGTHVLIRTPSIEEAKAYFDKNQNHSKQRIIEL